MTELPDEAIEAFLLGDPHDAWEQDVVLVGLFDEVMMAATGPAPRLGPSLAAFLGDAAEPATAPVPAALPAPTPWQPRTVAVPPAPADRGQNVVPLFRRLRLTVGIAVTAGVAAAALAVTATTGVLPEPATRAVAWVVEAVTPFELREPASPVSDAPQQGPTATVPPGPVAGPGPAGQGTPGQPAVTRPAAPPASIPAGVPGSIPSGVPGSVQPPGTAVGPGPASPFAPLVPGPPPRVAPPIGEGSGAPSSTVVDRPGHTPGDASIPSAMAGSPGRRP